MTLYVTIDDISVTRDGALVIAVGHGHIGFFNMAGQADKGAPSLWSYLPKVLISLIQEQWPLPLRKKRRHRFDNGDGREVGGVGWNCYGKTDH